MLAAALRQTSRASSSSLKTGLRASNSLKSLSAANVFRPGHAFARTLITKRYTKDHEAVEFDDEKGLGTVMITDYAQSSLGDVVFVELSEQGSSVGQGDNIGAVESVKAASDIYSPVSGTIEDINSQLSSEPSLLNKSPEQKGWLCKIKLADPSELEKLMSAEEYKAFCEEAAS
ncbi:uncharacterized protein STEHIDRAFT_165153 [Stereum hirsutum FP-91666 SS1]|uniref:uncharacterized protein n=1 Tax=Stereum hirsutum (strain FP-91666) TaxID=721885 RepID=UPI000440B9A4|nr:uncharacterized protein STEHIDRAFT_165153 [Stereum hirsutum FP-91666 SS1]EIM92980.1 hypothetical protein STEHIDRAFT_165153 [Stereum hirsutum FP-91666 SS1]